MGGIQAKPRVTKRDRVLYELPVLYELDDVEHAISARLSKGVMCLSVRTREDYFDEWKKREIDIERKLDAVRRKHLDVVREQERLQEAIAALEEMKRSKQKLAKVLGVDAAALPKTKIS